MEEKKKPIKPKFNIYWIYGLIAVAFIAMTFLEPQEKAEDIDPKKFQAILKSGDVERIVLVNEEYAEIYIKKDSVGKHKGLEGEGPHFKVQTGPADKFMEKVEELQAVLPETEHVIIEPEKRQDYLGDALSWLLPIIIIVAIWIFIFRRMSGGAGGGSQIFNIGKSKAQLFDKESQIKVNFNDVAGLDEAKVEIMEIVDFLKKPEKYTQLGGKIPKGALLVGPPGTGKTLLAKAVAGEANVPFFSISGSDFVEMFVGVGASRVRDLFRQAKTKAPCIVFIDEIDAIGRARGKNPNHGANDERENTLNQLLTEMDGFGTNSGVIILAATNRADILDKALMRAGRFDRQIHVELPELKEREAIFKVHIKPIKVADDVKVGFLAKQTPGFSGADIANICNESALIAARHDHPKVTKQDFLDAVDRVIGGLEKKSKVVTRTEKTTIAYHEAGHATVSWLLEFANPLVKVTIIPRGKALGAAWYLPEERQITTKDQMLDEMCATLGGRASEEINFGKVSSGALNDLERVTKYAYAMVTYYGMSDKVGNISYYDSTGQTEFAFTRPYSEKTAELIDEQVKDIVESQYSRALEILRTNKNGLVSLAEKLLEKEVIFSDDLAEVFGDRKFKTREEEIEHENNGKTNTLELDDKVEIITPIQENES
jgi:AFG3 family protein